jgi:hypothetical protein
LWKGVHSGFYIIGYRLVGAVKMNSTFNFKLLNCQPTEICLASFLLAALFLWDYTGPEDRELDLLLSTDTDAFVAV